MGRIIAIISKEQLKPWLRPVRVSAGGGDFIVSFKRDPRPTRNPDYHYTPSDQFKVKGRYVSERVIRQGVGAPVVVISRKADPSARERMALSRIYYGVTALARFNGHNCELTMEDPLARENVAPAGRPHPMAADFTVPLAAMLMDDENNPKRLGLARLFHPGKFEDTARIVRLDPFDPNKRVALVIHGLTGSQATRTPLIDQLRGDAAIRRNCQFWFFSYPGGYSYPYAAKILREELDRARRLSDLRKGIVVMGHSMGGCISRTLITDAGDKIWRSIFKEKPEQTKIRDEARQTLMQTLLLDHCPEVRRVIFFSAPLKGSELANFRGGRLIPSVIKAPSRLLKIGQEAAQILTLQGESVRLRRLPNSIETLSPKNRFVLAINKIPVREDIPHHTIIGDRGRGDSPNSSDGVVPCWSSHMETAVSEKVIPSGHGTHQHAEGIAEVDRILRQYAGR